MFPNKQIKNQKREKHIPREILGKYFFPTSKT